MHTWYLCICIFLDVVFIDKKKALLLLSILMLHLHTQSDTPMHAEAPARDRHANTTFRPDDRGKTVFS